MKTSLAKSLLLILVIFALTFSAMGVTPARSAGNLVGYWALDDGSGATAADSSGYGHPGALTGGEWSTSHAPTTFANTGSLSLDGSSGQGINATQVTAANDNVSMSAWVNWAGANALGQMLIYNGDSGPNGYGIYLQPNGELSILNGGVAIASSSTSFKLTPGVWQYVVAMRDAGVWKLYVDGIQVALNANPSPNPPSGQTSIGRGSVTTANTFNGLIDDARIYDRVLAATETCSPDITVTNANDSGAGSLRQAIAGLCSGGTITFNGNYTVSLASQLTLSQDMTIDGVGHTVTVSGDTTGDGTGDVRVFFVNSGVSFNLSNLTVTKGKVPAGDWCPANCGGGLYNDGGTLTVTNSTFSGNSAGSGGGIFNSDTLTVTNSTFSGNSATYGGGGIFNSDTLTVTNSTFSGNSATPFGGGIFNDYDHAMPSHHATATVTNCTFSGNRASVAGSIFNNGSATSTVKNTLMVKGTADNNCITAMGGSNNLADDATCGTGFTNSASILLGVLGNYGGSTQTIPLLPGSSAIDAGNSAVCAAAPVSNLDQRGIARPAACDIGAFESRGFTLAKTGGDNQSTVVNTAFTNPLALSVTSAFGEPVDGGKVTFTPPGSGASAAISGSPVTISGGVASLTATANGTVGGPYNVVASARGVAPTLAFNLTNLPASADLVITKTDSVTSATPGGSVTYTITASNAGPSSTPGATVVDTFPASLTANWTCVGAGGGTCTAAGSGNINDTVNLPAGGSVTYTVSAAISPSATGTLSNTATVSSSISDTNPGNNSATDTDTLNSQADLSITKTDGVTTAVPGGSLTYTITASNAGPSNVSGATVADSFPASLTATWTCVGAGGGTCSASGSGNINNIVNLPSGGSVTYTANANVSMSATGTVSNMATVTTPAGVTDPTPGNNSATDADTTIPPVDVSIEQASGQADPTNDSPINFEVVFASAVTDFDDATDVTLSGTAGATKVVITGGPSTYNVAVSGMTGDGTVIATLAMGVATGSLGEPNAAASSVDNTVDYIFPAPPVITEGSSINVIMSKNGSPMPFALTLHATDANSDPLTWSIQTQASSGIATVGAGTGIVSYTPRLNYTGADVFVVKVSDGNGGTDSITVNLTIQTPSAVEKINSLADTGDAQIEENEPTSAAIKKLLVIFNNSMDGTDVTDGAQVVANYTLTRDGSIPVTINTAAYDDPSKTTTLEINDGLALPEGKYTLTVKGSIHDSFGYAINVDFVRVFYIDTTGIQIITDGITLPGGAVIADGGTLDVSFSKIWVKFDEDAANPAGNTTKEDVTNPANYLLVRPGPDAAFETASCHDGVGGDDVVVPTSSVTYENSDGSGPFVAKVVVNKGTSLENGIYRLFVCGTTSITDLAGNHLNDGVDSQLSFIVFVSNSSDDGGDGEDSSAGKKHLKNPTTGFEPGVFTALPWQPTEKAYAKLGDLWLEMPSLSVKASITGVPLLSQGWDLSWLHSQIGWLEGTAYPTWNGNTVLTAHAYTSDGLPGPFVLLKNLKYGDTFTIHFNSQKYVYTVRSKSLVTASDTSLLTKHETEDWVTLITCQQFDEKSKTYLYRWVVRAVLTSVENNQ